MNPRARIYVAGGDTLMGRALIDHLHETGHDNLRGLPPHEPDLAQALQVDDFFEDNRPEYVFMAAGSSGGIEANQRFPADLILDNLLVSAHVLAAAFRCGVSKLVYLASSCVYPRNAPQPMRPESLEGGPLEPTNEAYATAKLAGIRLCQAYRRQHEASFVAAIPANVFGPHDDVRPGMGHVIPALMRRMHEAKLRDEKTLAIWGTGTPRREFIYARDLASACLFVMNHYDKSAPINLGCGADRSIADAAQLIAEVVGYRGKLCFDPSKPDGMPRKVLDSSKLLALGWTPATDFRSGLEATYAWFRSCSLLHPEQRLAAVLRTTAKREVSSETLRKP